MFCGEVEVVQVGNPHLLKSWGGVFCGEMEAVRAGNPHLLKSGGGGGFCGEVEAVRAGNPHCFGAGGVVFFVELKSVGGGGCFAEKWKPCGLATHTCLRAGGGGVLWRSGSRAGWQPALA